MTPAQLPVADPNATPPVPVLGLLTAPLTAPAGPLQQFAQMLLDAGPPPPAPPPLAGDTTRTAAAEGDPAGSDSSEPTKESSPTTAPAPEAKAKPETKEEPQRTVPDAAAQALAQLPPAPAAPALPVGGSAPAEAAAQVQPQAAQVASAVEANTHDPRLEAQPHAAVRPAAAAATGEGKTIAPAPGAGSSSPVAPPPPASDPHADARGQHEAPAHDAQPDAAPLPQAAPVHEAQPHGHDATAPAPAAGHEQAATAPPVSPAQPAPAPHEAARPAAPTPPPPPVRLNELAQAAQTTLKVAARAGETSATITLHPAELGSVEIRLHYGDDGVTATMHADTPQAAHALQQSAHELRRALENQGMNLLSLDVRDRREEAPRRDDQPARRVTSTGPVDGIAPADEVAVEIARLPAPGTQIDVLA